MTDFTRREIFQATAAVASAAAVVHLPLTETATADDRTTTERKLKVVIAGGHPDDPESGCGGTMARYAEAGHDVVALYLTRGEAGIGGTRSEEAARIRTKEAIKACELLGAKPVFAGQIDGRTEVSPQHYATYREILLAE